jgi:ABC-type glutathione transport system ATPase component
MKTVEIPNATSNPPDLGKSPEHDPLFRARGLTKICPSGGVEVRALDGTNLDLFEGELVVLLGASGSGKSSAELDCGKSKSLTIVMSTPKCVPVSRQATP